MGRKKTYDRDEIADRAMHLFWSNGYHSTTARQLADATGVNLYSLYAEFGSKEGLYQAAVERYERDMVTQYIGALEEPGASLSTLRNVLLQFAEFPKADGGAPGCLLCNAAIEQAPTPHLSQASTARYVSRLTRALTHALENARSDGSLQSDIETEPIGQYLCAVLLGLFVMIRAKVSVEIIDGTVEQAIAQLDALRTAAP